MRNYSGLNLQVEAIEDKNQYSVFPGLSRGLIVAIRLIKNDKKAQAQKIGSCVYLVSSYTHIFTAEAKLSDSIAPQP
jgi:hypothetical protein